MSLKAIIIAMVVISHVCYLFIYLLYYLFHLVMPALS